MNISQNEKERAIHRSYRMADSDRRSDLATARYKGWSEGRAAQRMEIARNLLKIDLPLEQIAMVVELTEEEIEELRVGEGS